MTSNTTPTTPEQEEATSSVDSLEEDLLAFCETHEIVISYSQLDYLLQFLRRSFDEQKRVANKEGFEEAVRRFSVEPPFGTVGVFPKPKLPWDYEIVMVFSSTTGTWIMTKRGDPMPYVIHRLALDGSCHYGTYCSSLTEAIFHFTRVIHV